MHFQPKALSQCICLSSCFLHRLEFSLDTHWQPIASPFIQAGGFPSSSRDSYKASQLSFLSLSPGSTSILNRSTSWSNSLHKIYPKLEGLARLICTLLSLREKPERGKKSPRTMCWLNYAKICHIFPSWCASPDFSLWFLAFSTGQHTTSRMCSE